MFSRLAALLGAAAGHEIVQQQSVVAVVRGRRVAL
jgi:hypothetical protein